ncbi:MAG: hypothetical protein KTR31_30920 [Myxococcales bacterium]|nr:hypothetical protein [Myxococcales bacterium]
MPKALRVLDVATGVIQPGPNTTVFVDGSLWAVAGCPVLPHGKPPCTSAVMTPSAGPHKVYVQGSLACHVGDQASCGCPGAPGPSLPPPTTSANG